MDFYLSRIEFSRTARVRLMSKLKTCVIYGREEKESIPKSARVVLERPVIGPTRTRSRLLH